MALEELDRELEAAREEERRNPAPQRWTVEEYGERREVDPLTYLRHPGGSGLGDLERVLLTASDEFILVVAGRHVVIGDHGALLTAYGVQTAIFRETGVAPRVPGTRPRWVPTANAIQAVAERIDEDEEARFQEPVNEETRAWVARVVKEAPRVALGNAEALAIALETKESFEGDDERLYLHGPAARAEAQRMGLGNWSQKEMGRRLRWLGYEQRQISARKGDTVHKARLWVSPENPASSYARNKKKFFDGDGGDTGTSLQTGLFPTGDSAGDNEPDKEDVA